MEKMPLKWVMGHQLSFVMALMFVLLDLTNEVSSGTVSQASELMEKLLTLCNSPLPEEKTVCICVSMNHTFLEKKTKTKTETKRPKCCVKSGCVLACVGVTGKWGLVRCV